MLMNVFLFQFDNRIDDFYDIGEFGGYAKVQVANQEYLVGFLDLLSLILRNTLLLETLQVNFIDLVKSFLSLILSWLEMGIDETKICFTYIHLYYNCSFPPSKTQFVMFHTRYVSYNALLNKNHTDQTSKVMKIDFNIID